MSVIDRERHYRRRVSQRRRRALRARAYACAREIVRAMPDFIAGAFLFGCVLLAYAVVGD